MGSCPRFALFCRVFRRACHLILQAMRKKMPTIRRKRALGAANLLLSLRLLSRPQPSWFWKSGKHETRYPIGLMAFLNAPSEHPIRGELKGQIDPLSSSFAGYPS